MTAENTTRRSDEAGITTVVNMKNRPDLRAALDGADEHGDVVRIDRRTRWGNPFLIGRHGSREEVIERYRAWLWGKLRKGEIQVADLAALRRRARSGRWSCATTSMRTSRWSYARECMAGLENARDTFEVSGECVEVLLGAALAEGLEGGRLAPAGLIDAAVAGGLRSRAWRP